MMCSIQWKVKILLIFNIFGFFNAYNFLGVFVFHSRSHKEFFASLLEELTSRGHNVTMISTYPAFNNFSNFKNVDLSDDIPSFHEVVNISNLDSDNSLSRIMKPMMLFNAADLTCKGLSSIPFQTFLRTSEIFDAILIEDFNSDCYLSVAHVFKAPIIGMSSSTMLPWSFSRYGLPSNPAVVPSVFLPFTDKMTFLERLENTVITFMHNLAYNYYRLNKDKAAVAKYIDEEATDLEKYALNISLMLVNNHFSLTLARALPPNVIEVGGLHIKKPKPLPQNLKQWIEESPNGVIYFCMGSMIKGQSFRKNERDAFIGAFDLLPYRVLWKYENETMEDKTEKILLRRWMPQLDVLCHPNVKLFISHGGLLGTMESIYCGVPMVVIPQFGDQFSNAAALEAIGGGVILQMSKLTKETAYKAIQKSLKMKDKSKELSERFRDRPLPPMETAVYWTEYVVKHGGAPFIKTAAVNMPVYQYYLLDVLTFIIIFLLLASYLFFCAFKFIMGRLLYFQMKKNKTD